jgi:tRNA G18 (ribose-2'-O)-methylase SpoU
MIIYGRNAIRESLKAKKLQQLLVLDRFEHDPMIEEARKSNVEVKFVSNEDELTRMAKNPSHQGFVAIVKDYEAVPLEDIISSAKSKAYPLVLILDGIEDPQNFGAILRSARRLRGRWRHHQETERGSPQRHRRQSVDWGHQLGQSRDGEQSLPSDSNPER